jgi:hypothetical protein
VRIYEQSDLLKCVTSLEQIVDDLGFLYSIANMQLRYNEMRQLYTYIMAAFMAFGCRCWRFRSFQVEISWLARAGEERSCLWASC